MLYNIVNDSGQEILCNREKANHSNNVEIGGVWPKNYNFYCGKLHSTCNSIFLHLVMNNEIIKIVAGLKNGTTPGPDMVLVGKISESLKEPFTSPIFKSGDRTNLTNYKPIT